MFSICSFSFGKIAQWRLYQKQLLVCLVYFSVCCSLQKQLKFSRLRGSRFSFQKNILRVIRCRFFFFHELATQFVYFSNLWRTNYRGRGFSSDVSLRYISFTSKRNTTRGKDNMVNMYLKNRSDNVIFLQNIGNAILSVSR